MRVLSAEETRKALPFRPLIETLRSVIAEFDAGHIICPERLVVPSVNHQGNVLSMVACAPDILAHKLLTIFPKNKSLPTLQGQVTCLGATDGAFLLALDGITTTERRTAAISMIGLEAFSRKKLENILLIGTGAQARVHLEALDELYPGVNIFIRGRTPEHVNTLVKTPYSNLTLHAEPTQDIHYDTVITVTSSTKILYNQPAIPETLVIGVGAYRPDMIEIGPQIVNNSLCIVDDPNGAPTEAGDIIQAGKNWQEVKKLSDFLQNKPDSELSVFFKSVGCAAWDLAACRLALTTKNLI
ncbi:ornithine cyclodeaminase [Acetobacter senegalensis]|uniref:Ornithine cyclodeaminase n=2 Tax=Acetobacter TaxID=434 RepID=A0A252EHS6_9PROT|nr:MULTISPECIES: delta(1)-pyrroline-2-carboxylate reductase family protein [Acetobacter]ATJ89367.1 ornithine cyclodeaminase [Acetobacter tropicalis]OUL65929.1 ornithine cyclodeaminase [Acetobacter senegalensis]